MLVLLPPSETKREGGPDGTRLELSGLSFPELTSLRRRTLTALAEVSTELSAAMSALKLGPTQASEAERNLRLRRSPVLPALDRYDGVLYDALGADTLTEDARAFAHSHLAIASALFGLTRALDPIPAYRLSADSRLPGLRLKAHWSAAVSSAVSQEPGLILDMRSEAYAALGPIPKRADAVFLRVVTEEGGRRRALNHFNKTGKGALARALLLAGVDHPDTDSLLTWAAAHDIRLESGSDGELDLIV